MTDVRVVYRKYDGSLHWNGYARRLGEDEHGVWLGGAAGSSMSRGYEAPTVYENDWVLLMPRGAWWTATFNAAPERTEIYCDITTVPEWPSPSEVTMVDLDLDVRRRRWGVVEVLDVDEFAEHRVRYGYPPEVVAAAEEAAEWLRVALGDGVEPFAGAYHGWLDQLR